MNLDHDFFQVSKLSEDQKKVFTKYGTLFFPISGEHQKKRSSPKMELFFSPNSGEDQKKEKKFTPKISPNSTGGLRSHALQSQIIGGDADKDHTQIIGGINPPSPPGFWHP